MPASAGNKVVPRSLRPFLDGGAFYLGVINMDFISIVLILIGSIMVYGTKHIFKVFKQNADDKRILTVKLIGLLIGLIGFLRIFDII